MKGDFTGIRRWPAKHYASVRMQQGRVQLDSDWNDQVEIQEHLDRSQAIDVIGPAGGPKGSNGGLRLEKKPDGSDLTLSAGRFWLDGLLCELDSPASYAFQPNLPSPPFVSNGALSLPEGTYVAYVEAWEQHVTALEDPDLLEPALRGVDTTTRVKVIWQVKLLPVADATGTGACDTSFPEWSTLLTPPSGKLSGRANPSATAASRCSVESSGGYTRLENQLYRIEIHTGGDRSTATFKWSRENGSVVASWTGLTGNVLSIQHAGRDEVLGFTAGDWVELTDDEREQVGQPGTIVRLKQVDKLELTVDPATFDPPGSVLHFADFKTNLKVRRWEGDLPTAKSAARSLIPTPPGDGFLDLENGVQVKFEDGTYQAGDYWVVPARTVLADVVWPKDATATPIPASPLGTQRHRARLAMLHKTATALSLTSCYPQFPALTAITASDVGFDNTTCECNPAATTVQQAIDWLCQQDDLAFHKKQLHGWGIVCGLQVACGPDAHNAEGTTVHDTITVKNGYAIDASGHDILVSTKDANGQPVGDAVKILDLITKSGALAVDPGTQKLKDGSVSLFLTKGELSGRYGVEPYDGSSESFSGIFQNTFWWDVLHDCIQRVTDAFKDEFTGSNDGTAEHIAAALNILAQLIFPRAGARVFISPKEDQILRDFYVKLRGILQSETFCAMFDGVTKGFPDYNPIYAVSATTPRPSTVIGKAARLREKMRIDPAGKFAYVMMGSNGDATIEIFDVSPDTPTQRPDGGLNFPHVHEKFVGEAVFPVSGAVVQDVAFSKDGATLYALAVLNKTDALFASADVSDPSNVKWNPLVTTLCSTPLVTIVYSAQQNKYYAIGTGKGLYQIDTASAKLVPNQQPISQFNATGQLVIADVGTTSYAYFTIGTGPTYTAVGRLDLQNVPPPATAPFSYSLPALVGNDDLAVVSAPNGQFHRLYVVTNPSGSQTSKQLMVFDATATTAPAAPLQVIPLRYIPSVGSPPTGVDASIYRLAYDGPSGRLLVMSADAFLLETYDVAANGNALSQLVIPVQISPRAIAASQSTQCVFVLNEFSGTVSTVPSAYFASKSQPIDLANLATYHSAVLKAFVDLFGQFLQYLKDCVCHHFLIECPDAAAKTLYLARVDVKNGQVYNICNFSRRKYVHSFPTVEYWMSVVPILPVIRKLIGDACCTVLQNKFASFTPAEPAAAKADFISPSTAMNAVGTVRQIDPKSLWATQVTQRLNVAGSVTSALFGSVKSGPSAPAAPAAATLGDVRQQPAASATQVLGQRGVLVVGNERAQATDLLALAKSPTDLAAGDRVILVTDANDNVLGYRKPAAATSAAAGPADAAQAQNDQRIVELQARMASVETSQGAALAQRDQQIAKLQNDLGQLQGLQQTLAQRDEQIAKLGAQVTELHTTVQGMRATPVTPG